MGDSVQSRRGKVAAQSMLNSRGFPSVTGRGSAEA